MGVKRPDDARHDTFLANVGRRIAETRQWRELTQEELAEVLAIIPRAMQKIEAGENLTLRTIARIADALDVDPGALVAGTATPRSKAPPKPRAAPRSPGASPRRSK